MKQPNLTIETARHVHPSGRAYLEFTPVFTPDVCAAGQLRFAVWAAQASEPQRGLTFDGEVSYEEQDQ